MTRRDIWQQRALAERGLILQILYVATLPHVDRRTIDGSARCVNMPIEPEHLTQHLHHLVQAGYVAEQVGRAMGLALATYALLPRGRDLVLGAIDDPGVVLPADME